MNHTVTKFALKFSEKNVEKLVSDFTYDALSKTNNLLPKLYRSCNILSKKLIKKGMKKKTNV